MQPSDVPAGPLAVDTDVFSFIHTRGGRYKEFEPLLEGHQLALPFSVVAELKVLTIRRNLGQARRDALEAHVRRCTVIPSDARVVDEWARLYARLLDRLKGGGINDLWAAACCLVYGLPIVTNNLSDFRTIQAEAPTLQIVHPDL